MIDLLSPSLSLVDFLPDSIASDEDVIALSRAIDPELRAVAAAVSEAIIWPNIAQLPAPVIEILGHDTRLDELQIWDTATLDGRRALLANIFAIRKRSGTRFAVRRIFDLLSVVGSLVEWWEEGAPHDTYRIRLTVAGDPGITKAQLLQIPELLHRFARASQQLTELAVEADERGQLTIYPVGATGRHVTIQFGA